MLPLSTPWAFPDLEVGPVILDELVRVEHVAPDRVSAESHAHHTPLLRQLLLSLLFSELCEAGLEDPHRRLLVGGLRPLVLALDDHARREVGDPDRGVGLVDVLAAGALRSVGVDAQVALVDRDVAVL